MGQGCENHPGGKARFWGYSKTSTCTSSQHPKPPAMPSGDGHASVFWPLHLLLVPIDDPNAHYKGKRPSSQTEAGPTCPSGAAARSRVGGPSQAPAYGLAAVSLHANIRWDVVGSEERHGSHSPPQRGLMAASLHQMVASNAVSRWSRGHGAAVLPRPFPGKGKEDG